MSSQREFLEESRDSWQESAKHDKKQFLGSLIIAATGIVQVGVGIGYMANGDLAGGALEVAVGATIAIPMAKKGLTETQDYADMTAQVAVRQSQIDELNMEDGAL